MDRRGFLKNSIGALLFGALTSNKVLAEVIDVVPKNSMDVLLYLIQNKDGDWKVKGTIWPNLAKDRLSETYFNLDTFKPLKVVDNKDANKIKKFYWVQYGCKGRCVGLDYLQSYKNGLNAKESIHFSSFVKSGGITQGFNLYKNKKGLWGRNEEKIKKDCSEGGKIIGKINSENGQVSRAGKISAKSSKHPNNTKEKCIHCGYESTLPLIRRWHNDNCKHKQS